MEEPVRIAIGRKSDEGRQLDISFPADQDDVSRFHAVATWAPALGCVVVRDQGSVNGTEGVDGAVEVADGSIRVEPGQAVLLGEQRLEFDDLKSALERKLQSLEAQQAKQSAEQTRLRKRRKLVIGLVSLLVIAAFTAGVSVLISEREQRQLAETDIEQLRSELTQIRELAADAGLVLDEARAAREIAEQALEQSRRDFGNAEMVGSFVLNQDGTVTDARTGLMWRQCPLGMDWVQEEGCSGVFERYPWILTGSGHTVQDGLELINKGGGYAGYDDWRLPESWELLTLVSQSGGLREPKAFLEVPLAVYWTRTPQDRELRRYQVIDFIDGLMKWHEGARQMPIMVVRTHDSENEED